MQKAVEDYLAEHMARDAAYREKVLIEAGLFERKYVAIDENFEGDDTFDYDSEKNEWYQKIPLKISDEEWEAVKAAYESQHTAKAQTVRSYNPVSKLLKIFAIAIYVIGFILGIVLGRTVNYLGGRAAFSFASALVYWIAFFVAGTMMYGFSEIVRLLQVIADK